MPVNPTSPKSWSTSATEVQRRLEKANQVLRAAQAPDGSVDLKQAKALAGSDANVSLLVNALRWERATAGLTPAQAQHQFQELAKATGFVPLYDTNHDGQVTSSEIVPGYNDDLAKRLLITAASPGDAALHGHAPPRVKTSLAARQEAERLINQQCDFHAETPLGAEALKWAVRESVVTGWDVHDKIAWDAVNHSESSWQSKLPFSFFDEHRKGEGHLSDKELRAYFRCDLPEFIEKAKARVSDHLLMDYETAYLKGADL